MPATASTPATVSTTVTNAGLTLSAYPGDGALLLGFSLDPSILKNNSNLAGFAIQCTPPSGQPYFLMNRLNFSQPVTSGTAPAKRPFTGSNIAPFPRSQDGSRPARRMPQRPSNFFGHVRLRHR